MDKVQVSAGGVVPNPTLEEELAATDAANATAAAAPADGKILGKFNDHAALETGYSELEQSNSKMAQELAALRKGAANPAAADPTAVDAADPAAVEAEAKAAVEGAGVDFDALSASYAENGELSDDQFAALEKGGIPRSMVEQFIAGQEALGERMSEGAHRIAGSAEAYVDLTAWAGETLTEAEIALYNTEVNSADKTRIDYAVTNLKARFDKSEGVEPSRRVEGVPPALGADVFGSWAEVTKVMQSEGYKTDEAIRAKVADKLSRSKLK